MYLYKTLIGSSPVHWKIQDEDLRALWFWRSVNGAEWRLPWSTSAIPQQRHLFSQCHGRLLDPPWAPQLHWPPVLPAPWRIQEARRVGKSKSYHGLPATCDWPQLKIQITQRPLPVCLQQCLSMQPQRLTFNHLQVIGHVDLSSWMYLWCLLYSGTSAI